MKPGLYDHRFTAGDDYEVAVTLKQDGQLINTEGYVFKAEIREGYLPHGELRGTFGVTLVPGGCRLALTAEQTRALTPYRRLVWDLQSESPAVRTWLTGAIQLGPDVTNGGVDD